MGPAGQGSQTGRGAGYCRGNAAPGAAPAGCRCFGGGRGRGEGKERGRHGRRNMFYATGLTGGQRAAAAEQTAKMSAEPAEQDEIALLTARAAELAAALQQV